MSRERHCCGRSTTDLTYSHWFKCLFFFVESDELVHHILSDLHSSKKKKSRVILRMLPVRRLERNQSDEWRRGLQSFFNVTPRSNCRWLEHVKPSRRISSSTWRLSWSLGSKPQTLPHIRSPSRLETAATTRETTSSKQSQVTFPFFGVGLETFNVSEWTWNNQHEFFGCCRSGWEDES